MTQTRSIPSSKDAIQTQQEPMALRAAANIEIYNTAELIQKIPAPQTSKICSKKDIQHKTSFKDEDSFTLFLKTADSTTPQKFHIENCHSFSIQSEGDPLSLQEIDSFFINIHNCHDFSINGLTLSAGNSTFAISNSSDFLIHHCSFTGINGTSLTVFASQTFSITDCFFHNLQSTGILIVGKSTHGYIDHCLFTTFHGFLNHDAAIHLCATSPNITRENLFKARETIHEPLSIEEKIHHPCHIIISHCHISHCRAQGIYLEGAINCLITHCIITACNKEGICFDWGSCYNIFEDNTITGNGNRSNLTETEIAADFIAQYPLLEDGSCSMKLPGISIDNGCANRIERNTISSNFGGGIKMIRTALFNVISENIILFNSTGANSYVPFFPGISILGLGCINNEFDKNSPHLLDFFPSNGNTISRNSIQEISIPIRQDKLCQNNKFTENKIEGPFCKAPSLYIFSRRVQGRIKRNLSFLFRLLK